MNFEKIELYGFKSFADKAEIRFGNGITGIVGPNGCGKSNVADAIRWVLGEQSAKSLRGSNMQDVIFSGTQGRKSLSYCEVSLFFDNSNRMFSIDYNEVIITRKLFRSGESEYFINKQPARLKDIVDLLHECGIGKEGYTIIGQGKVEEIMSAKPEDRRTIFEEATGIAKFKSRKNESERKLERTRENLVRYIDILTEIENQLGPLERQAEKAKEFNALTEELKYNEINTYIYKVEGVSEEKGKINTKISGIEEQVALRQKEYDDAVREYDRIFGEISTADEKLKGLNNDLIELRVNIEQNSSAKKLYGEKISNLLTQIENANRIISENETTISQCEKGIEIGKEELASSNQDLLLLSKKADELSSSIKRLNEKIALGEELNQESRKKFIQSIEDLSVAKIDTSSSAAKKESLNLKLNELTEKLNGLYSEKEDFAVKKEQSEQAVDALEKETFDVKNQISDKENEIREINGKIAEVDRQIYSLNTFVSALATKDIFYREQKEHYEGYSNSVKLLLNEANKNAEVKGKIKGVVAELLKCDKKFDVAIETALGAGAQNVVTKDTEDAKYLIQFLKTNNFGRITFLPITSVKPRERINEVVLALRDRGSLGVADELVNFNGEFKNVISNLLGNTLVVDNIDNASEIAKKYHFNFRIVTLEGDIISNQGSYTGGSKRGDIIGLLSNDRKIEDNAKELEEKRANMQSLKDLKAEKEKARDALVESLNGLSEVLNNKNQEIVLEREKQSNIENRTCELEKDIESTNDLIATVKDNLSEVNQKIEQLSKGGEKLEKDKLSASISADKQQAEYDTLRKQREALINENTDVSVKITEFRAKIDAISGEIERYSQTAQSSQRTNEKLRQDNANASVILEELRAEQDKVALTKEEQESVDKLKKEIDGIEEYKQNLREGLNLNDQKKTEVNNEISELIDRKNQGLVMLAKIDSDLEHLGQTIWEDYQETYETVLSQRDENYDATHGEAEINRIRRKRSSLGAINASAIDDYKALRERYDEMTTQKEDLEKAEKDLKDAIDKIKGEMLTQFDEGFNLINQNFQKIFKELFGGGRAMLEIDYTQVEDKLEAGIEIIAEPPGKKLQKLSLLSGGEKALTAIAILFAILKLRPMPFCVLDEVEAALDEANVDRFAKYLQKFSQDTQFIVITHKKPTMERADSLFGVTMQEKGVSKLVSVKLSDVAEITGDIALA